MSISSKVFQFRLFNVCFCLSVLSACNNISNEKKVEILVDEYDKIGIGKVILDYEHIVYNNGSYEIGFYDSYLSANPSNKFKVSWIEEKGGYIKAENNAFISIKDFYIDEPYYIIHFTCIREKEGFLEVIVDEGKSKKMWIKKSHKVKLKEWPNYLMSAVCVSQKNKNNNPVRKLPNNSSELLSHQESCWEIINFKGHWAKIKYHELDIDMTKKENKAFFGWIKWRNDSEILVDYFLSI